MENKFLKIKKYTSMLGEYFYAERLGKDSIAFILYDKNIGHFGLINEFKPPIDEFLLTAFGGSLDKDGKSFLDIVKAEIREESGYVGGKIKSCGKYFVSTQMNQFCYLYLVDVTKAKFVGKEPETYWESISTVEWVTRNRVIEGQCWKAVTIIARSGL